MLTWNCKVEKMLEQARNLRKPFHLAAATLLYTCFCLQFVCPFCSYFFQSVVRHFSAQKANWSQNVIQKVIYNFSIVSRELVLFFVQLGASVTQILQNILDHRTLIRFVFTFHVIWVVACEKVKSWKCMYGILSDVKTNKSHRVAN